MSTKLLNEDAAAEVLGVSPRWMQRARVTGDGPPFVRIGKRRVGYPEGPLGEWQRERTFSSRAAELAASSAKRAD